MGLENDQETIQIAREELERTYGPSWQPLVVVGVAIESLTDEDIHRLGVRSARDWAAVEAAASAAVWAAGESGMAREFGETKDAILLEEAKYVVWAAVTRHLVGHHGYTQAHYDALTKTFVEVVGKLSPSDPDQPAVED